MHAENDRRRSLSDYGRSEADPQDYNDGGVDFYAALARETGGPVLEVACGTGRVTVPLARLGIAVTGLDIRPELLDIARTKSSGLAARWVQGDGRTFDLGERFRLIFLTGNAFQQFLTNEDQKALLDRARAHLDDGGLFAFETRNPLWATPSTRADLEATIEKARLRTDFFTLLETRVDEQPWQTYVDSRGRRVRETFTQEYDPVAQILHLLYRHWIEGSDEPQTRREILRYTFPQELAAMLHGNGFTIVRQHGDWSLEPLTAHSLSIIVVCRTTESAAQ